MKHPELEPTHLEYSHDVYLADTDLTHDTIPQGAYDFDSDTMHLVVDRVAPCPDSQLSNHMSLSPPLQAVVASLATVQAPPGPYPDKIDLNDLLHQHHAPWPLERRDLDTLQCALRASDLILLFSYEAT